MTFLPIVERELRVAARRRSTYWSRLLAALGAVLLGGFVYLTLRGQPSPDLGMYVFETVAAVALFVCVIGGVRATADSLSEEKREGTLGLLFLTDLKGHDVVLGKLAATSLGGFYGLLAIFPVLAIPLLMGGVTQGEFWRMTLGLVDAFLFSLALGLFASAISRDARRAMAKTLGLIFLFSVVLPLLGLWLGSHGNGTRAYWTWRNLPLLVASPYPIFTKAFDAGYRVDKDLFWWSVGVTHALTWFFILLASLIVPHCWQDRPNSAASLPRRERRRQWIFGGESERRSFRTRLLGINPYYWLASRARESHLVWVFLGITAGLWGWGAVGVGHDWFDASNYLFTTYVVNAVLKVWVASAAGYRLGEDKKSGALELLLSTPLGVSDILRGQILALRRQFLGPIAAVLLVEAVFLLASTRQGAGDSSIAPVMISFMVMFTADVVAASCMGMWVGLSARNRNRATGITVARILVIPNVAWLVLIVIVGIVSKGYSGYGGGKIVLGLWLGLGIFTDVICAQRAWRRLNAEFRQRAVERHAPAREWSWQRLDGSTKTAAAESPRTEPPG